MDKKRTIGIIFGGQSEEHEISLMSAYNVIEAMNLEKYDIVTIGITKKGKWMIYTGSTESIIDGSWEKDKNNLIKDFSLQHSLLKKINVLFPVLHGPMGEDGTIQGLFELANIPYVGCGVLSSAIGMDKVYTKIVFEKIGLPQLDYFIVIKQIFEKNKTKIINEIEKNFKYPVFIKPVNMGSSIGITKAHNKEELIGGIEEASKYDRKILVEQFIECIEVECAVLGNDEPEASVLGEIISSKEFYDYKAKYFDDNKSRLIIPSPLNINIKQKIKKYAIQAFKAIEGSGLARVDFFIDKNTNNVYINEINTMPGFTNTSMYPKLWEYSGLSYSNLIDRLIQLAVEKFECK